jgi:6-phospho-beta-glucosidase
VGSDGPVAVEQAPLAPVLLGLVQHVAAYERLVARAAVSRDPGDVRLALLALPLIGQLDRVDALAEEMLAPAVGGAA